MSRINTLFETGRDWKWTGSGRALLVAVLVAAPSQMSCVREIDKAEDESTGGLATSTSQNPSSPTTAPDPEVGPGGADQGSQDGGIPGGEGIPGEPEKPEQKDDPAPESPGPDDTGAPSQADPEEELECKDGASRSCQETPEGAKVAFPTGAPVGGCKLGKQDCRSGRWGQCVGVVGPKASDRCDAPGDDSNCNGVPNDGCDCVDNESRPCGKSNQGECRMGVQLCVGGKWSDECDGAVMPAKELCDGAGRDEDCDGRVDLDDEQCDCLAGAFEYCSRAGQKGDCKVGRRTCKEGRWGVCEEWAKPESEKCGKRASVPGVEWSGDENCDGDIDTSPLGRKGPEGCVRMMLDRDGDSYGAIGPDLSEIKAKNQVSRLGTACLCKERPDFQDKEREGWVAVNGKENRDCGDCPPGKGGESVYPGSWSSAVESNQCLEQVGWTIGSKSNPMKGDFDLNCDGRHTDPEDSDGFVGEIKCLPNDADSSCGYASKGRLIPKGDRKIWCGGTFEVGKCIPAILDTPKFPNPTLASTRQTHMKCDIVGTGRKHTIRCQ